MCVQCFEDSAGRADRPMCSRPRQFSEAVDEENRMCRGEDAHQLVHVSSLPISQGNCHISHGLLVMTVIQVHKAGTSSH